MIQPYYKNELSRNLSQLNSHGVQVYPVKTDN